MDTIILDLADSQRSTAASLLDWQESVHYNIYCKDIARFTKREGPGRRADDEKDSCGRL